ncbi:MAG TPA: glycosyltransferase family 9 protein [Myxococcota bacterium]|nr:glycosyltransferase family 9 protein [Myxococcota bacterium]
MKAVVLQSALLGDVVFTLPLVQALCTSDRYEAVAVAATPNGAEIVRLHGAAAALVDDKHGADRGPRGLARVAGRARAWADGEPLEVYAAHGSVRTALLARAVGGARRIGFASAPLARLVYAVRAPGREPRDVARYLALAVAAGTTTPAAAAAAAAAGPRLATSAVARAAARARLGTAARAWLGLGVGSRRATKDWPERRLVEAVRLAAAYGFAGVCLLGGPDERPRAARLRAAAAAAGVAVHDATGEPLADAAATLAVLDAVVGPDSGLTHLARAVGTPSVVLFGPTDEARHVPVPHTVALVRAGLACRPCHHAGPPRCPLGHHACLEELDAPAALRAAAALRARREAELRA